MGKKTNVCGDSSRKMKIPNGEESPACRNGPLSIYMPAMS